MQIIFSKLQVIYFILKRKSKLPNNTSTTGYSHIKREKFKNILSNGGPLVKVWAAFSKTTSKNK